ncbi:MAG: outer membrane beta-barrel protein [Flavobacteriales bacterium]|nr:outer membrane beta-barrel protein [Flavobacteriales bacterium]
MGGALGIANYYTNAEIINRYTLEDPETLQSFFVPVDKARDIKRNKLTITYADIPFEIRYRSVPDKHGYSWKIAAGFKVGYHIQAKSKMIEDAKKTKTYDFQNYEKWRYGLNLRVAYGRVGINAFYSATSIFEDGKGETVNPISVGITLMPF